MSQKSFARLRLISIAIFVVGAVSAVVAYSLHKRSVPELRHRKGFTLRIRSTSTPNTLRKPGPKEITHANTTRYQRSDGTFKQVRTYYNAKNAAIKKDILFGIPGQGVFEISNPRGPLNFLSSMPPKETTSYVAANDGHTEPNFSRDDWVKGYETYVLHFPDPDGGYTDMYCAAELDGAVVKTVSVSNGAVSIDEVVEITLGEPDERVFGPLPPALVNYDLFRSKIAAMEESGRHEAAEAMQRELEEQIAKQMKD